ncbi:copper resistance CopC family protein [Segeticoccus rhizosphaerae]|jgi:methionine-rich copper-binding protein CopC|uniref:copper resistance CopC family protein n=1 Tax=Segeticoccus rhizosphaerae TaxID=1104777 RepID=UPI0010BF6A09|nr:MULTISPECIES: copper resistance CopC family protein [Intrasporangiaceae]
MIAPANRLLRLTRAVAFASVAVVLSLVARPLQRCLTIAALALAALALTWGAGASPAAAHDVLIKTTPADGASVPRLPDKVTLTFDDPALALGTELRVTGPSGQVQEGKPVLVDNTVSQAVRPGSPAGSYTVVWRVTSEDGHPVSGTFRFTAAKGNGGTAPSAKANPSAASPANSSSSSAANSPAASSPATSSAGSTQQQSESGSSMPWIAGVVAIVIVLGGVGLWLRWRRRA